MLGRTATAGLGALQPDAADLGLLTSTQALPLSLLQRGKGVTASALSLEHLPLRARQGLLMQLPLAGPAVAAAGMAAPAAPPMHHAVPHPADFSLLRVLSRAAAGAAAAVAACEAQQPAGPLEQPPPSLSQREVQHRRMLATLQAFQAGLAEAEGWRAVDTAGGQDSKAEVFGGQLHVWQAPWVQAAPWFRKRFALRLLAVMLMLLCCVLLESHVSSWLWSVPAATLVAAGGVVEATAAAGWAGAATRAGHYKQGRLPCKAAP